MVVLGQKTVEGKARANGTDGMDVDVGVEAAMVPKEKISEEVGTQHGQGIVSVSLDERGNAVEGFDKLDGSSVG